MRRIAMIPARYAATRFPGKLMYPLGGIPIIRHTYENTLNTGLFDEVVVVADDDRIIDEIVNNGGKAVKSSGVHESGTDRIAEAAQNLDADLIVNVQGDEPFVKKEPLEKLLHLFEGNEGKEVQVASLMQLLEKQEEINNPNHVKVVTDKNGYALYFSRSVIPFLRNKDEQVNYYQHIGVYAFRKNALLQFTQLPATPLELSEKLEQLRLLENGIRIKMAVTGYMGAKIDVPEDMQQALIEFNVINEFK